MTDKSRRDDRRDSVAGKARSRSGQARAQKPERAEVASESLKRMRLGAATFLQNISELSPVARVFVQSTADQPTPGQRMGMSREEALKLMVKISESMGANSSYANIVAGAADVFGLEGFERPSIADVLRKSGVSRRTFYQFFRNKEDVLAANQDLVTSVWLDTIRQATEYDGSAEQKLKRTVRTFVGAFTLAGWFIQVMISEAMRGPGPLAERHDWFVDGIARLIQPLVDEHFGSDVDPLVVRARLGGLIGVAMDRRLTPDTDQEAVGRIEQIMLDILLAPVHPPRQSVPDETARAERVKG